MTNSEVISNFVKGIECKSSNGNLYVTKWDGTVRLINYNTCIAQKIGNKIVVNGTKYSPTTAKIQCYVRRQLINVEYKEVTGIPRNTVRLDNYFE